MAKLDLKTPRPLRMDHAVDGFVTAAIDMTATKALQKRVLFAHLICMALFLTVVLAIPAWLFALANILVSPKLAYQRIEVNAREIRLQPLLSRGELTVQEVSDGHSSGTQMLGRGAPPTPTVVRYGDIKHVDWTEHSVRIYGTDGSVHTLDLQLTSRDDISRLGQAIRHAWEGAGPHIPLTPEERASNERDRRQLERMAQHRIKSG